MPKTTLADLTTGKAATDAYATGDTQPVIAKVPQGYEAKLNIRLVPGRDFNVGTIRLGCRPRKGGQRRDADPVALPEDLTGKLRDANKKVVAWLAADTANTQLFLAKPVEALMKAGVELTRTEQKALGRTYSANHEDTVIAPGVKITDLTAVAHPTGRVGGIKPGGGTTTTGGRDVGCGFTRKGKE